MLYAGLDLSRKKVDVHVLDGLGRTIGVTSVPPERRCLLELAARFSAVGEEVTAVIESMTGARFVHDTLELAGWEVLIADAARARALAPLTAKTDRIDAWVLAELGRRDLVPAIWLPDIGTRSARELCRFRQHLVGHRAALKNRVHATLVTFGHPVAMSDLFGRGGRSYLASLEIPEPWHTTLERSLELIAETQERIAACERELLARSLHDPYVPLLVTVPGIGLVLGSLIAAEIGDIGRFPSAKQFVGYTGLCPIVRQSGGRDDRGPLARNGPKLLRWALVEVATHASAHPAYRAHYQRTRQRLGRRRGPAVARVELARTVATAIWHMLTTNQPFAPAGPATNLVA
jgi:transposase